MSAPVTPAGTGDQNQQPPTENQPSGDQAQVTPPGNQDQSAVDKAYEKLREAEDREKQVIRENKQLKEKDLPEAQRQAAEAEALRTENSDLKNQLQQFAAEKVAALKGFVDPEAAVAVLLARKVDISDKDKAEKALINLADEKKNMVSGEMPPSGGPVQPQRGSTPTGNAGMNAEIRRAAGRG